MLNDGLSLNVEKISLNDQNFKELWAFFIVQPTRY
jgi:hypothetical protein